jgi:hypothetical protein
VPPRWRLVASSLRALGVKASISRCVWTSSNGNQWRTTLAALSHCDAPAHDSRSSRACSTWSAGIWRARQHLSAGSSHSARAPSAQGAVAPAAWTLRQVGQSFAAARSTRSLCSLHAPARPSAPRRPASSVRPCPPAGSRSVGCRKELPCESTRCIRQADSCRC